MGYLHKFTQFIMRLKVGLGLGNTLSMHSLRKSPL